MKQLFQDLKDVPFQIHLDIKQETECDAIRAYAKLASVQCYMIHNGYYLNSEVDKHIGILMDEHYGTHVFMCSDLFYDALSKWSVLHD